MLITMDQLGTAPNAPRYEVSTDLIELNRHFVSIIDSICTELEREYGIVFTRSNKYQFTLRSLTRAVRNRMYRCQAVPRFPSTPARCAW